MPEWAIQAVMTAALGVIAWVLKRAIGKIDGHDRDIAAIRLDLAQNYVKHKDLDDIKAEQKRTTRALNRMSRVLAVIADRLKVAPPAEIEAEGAGD